MMTGNSFPLNFGFVFFAFLITTALAAIKYMFYKMIGNERQIVMVKAEILDAIAVMLLGYFLINFFDYYLDQIATMFNMGGSFVDGIKQSLESSRQIVEHAYKKGLDDYSWWSFLSSLFSFSAWGIPVLDLVKKPLSSEQVFNTLALSSLIINYAFPAMIAFDAAIAFFDYINNAFIYIALVGLSLRMFSPTRALGAGLFVFAFVSYIITPSLFYLFVASIPVVEQNYFIAGDFCGVPYASSAIITTSMNEEVFSNLVTSSYLDLESIEGFLRSFFVKLLFGYVLTLGFSLLFLFYGTLILSRGVVAYSFLGKLSSLL